MELGEENPWWVICYGCGLHRVDPSAPPQYDVLAPDYDPDDPQDVRGPYCVTCFATTASGSAVVN